MKRAWPRALTAASLALAALLHSPALQAADASTPAKPNADAILRQMSSTLAAAHQFSFEAHRTIDPTLLGGHNLPADAHVVVEVQRPNKVAANGPGAKGIDPPLLSADGQNLHASVAM